MSCLLAVSHIELGRGALRAHAEEEGDPQGNDGSVRAHPIPSRSQKVHVVLKEARTLNLPTGKAKLPILSRPI